MMDVDSTSREATTMLEDFILPPNTTISDFSNEADYYPELTTRFCTENRRRLEGAPRVITIPQGDTNKFLVVSRVLQTGVSPVFAARVADGSFISQARYRRLPHALKIYAPHLLTGDRQAGEDPRKEAAVLQFLRGKHENILSIIDCHENSTTGELFLEMPLYTRGDCLTLIENMVEGHLPLQLARNAMQSLFSAMHYLHSLGITHHDISPEQLLYDEASNRFVLIDFGMCIRQALDPASGTFLPYPHPHFCGKHSYMAYEVISRSEAPSPDPTKRDIWAAGPTLFMLLTGTYLHKVLKQRDPVTYRQYPIITHEYYSDVAATVAAKAPLYRRGRGAEYDLAMELVVSLMSLQPGDRPSAAQALMHPWFLHSS